MSKEKVPVQKGPIRCDEPTMKTMGEMETLREDMRQGALRKDGQTPRLQTPKQ